MTPMITAPIQVKLTDDEFNNRYKMYKRLKELLQLSGETQFMCLTREYYTLNYRNYKDISEFLDHVSLEKQIEATNIEITPDKQTLLCLMMALWNKSYYRSLVQIWGVTKDITVEKAREMLLEDEKRLKADSEISALVIHSHGHQGKGKDSCRYCGKTGDKEDACWKKYPELIPNQYKSEEKDTSLIPSKKALSMGRKRLC